MNWSPNLNQGQPPQAPNAAQGSPPTPQHGAPQPGGYTGPGAGQGYGGQAAGGPPRINFGAPNLNDREPSVPFGDHVLRSTGRVEFVGQKNDLLIVEFEVVQTNNPAAQGAKGCWKRKLTGTHVATDQMVSNAIGQMVVPLSGRQKQTCPPQEALALIAEFYNNRTLDGKPLAGMSVGASVTPGNKTDPATGQPYPKYVFHTL